MAPGAEELPNGVDDDCDPASLDGPDGDGAPPATERPRIEVAGELTDGVYAKDVILAIIGGIQGFEGAFIMTRGGPGFRTTVPGLWMYYNAMSFQRIPATFFCRAFEPSTIRHANSSQKDPEVSGPCL